MSIFSKFYNKRTQSKLENINAKKDRKKKIKDVKDEIKENDFESYKKDVERERETLENDMETLKIKRNTKRLKDIPRKKASRFKYANITSQLISTLTSICGISITFDMIDINILFSNYWFVYLFEGGRLGYILALILLGFIFNRGINFTYILLEEHNTIKYNFNNKMKIIRYVFSVVMVIASILTNYIFWITLLKNIYIACLFSVMFDIIGVISIILYNIYYYMFNMQLDEEKEEEKSGENEQENTPKNTNENTNKKPIGNTTNTDSNIPLNFDFFNCDKLDKNYFKDEEKEEEKSGENEQENTPKNTNENTNKKPIGNTTNKGKRPGRKIDKRTREKIRKAIEQLEQNTIITKKKVNYKGDDKLLKVICEELKGILTYSKVGKDNKTRYYRL